MAKQTRQDPVRMDPGGVSPRPPGFIIKKYNAVVQSAKLLDIRMTSSRFDVRSEYFLLREREREENKRLIKLGMEDYLKEWNYVKEEGVMFGELSWLAYSKRGRTKVLSVKADYLAVYSSATDLDELHVKAFLGNVGKFATFPYFRALVSTYSAASSADLPILPVLKQPIDAGTEEKVAVKGFQESLEH